MYYDLLTAGGEVFTTIFIEDVNEIKTTYTIVESSLYKKPRHVLVADTMIEYSINSNEELEYSTYANVGGGVLSTEEQDINFEMLESLV